MDEQNNNGKKIKEFSDDSLKEIAKEIVVKRLALKTHLTAYVSVNILLFIINIFTDRTFLWFLWPLMGWGLAISFHIFNYISFKQGFFSSESSAFLGYHIYLYVVVNLFLLFINWFTLNRIDWAIWPIIGWGLGILFHFIKHYSTRPRKGEDPRKSYIDRQIDKELSKIKEN